MVQFYFLSIVLNCLAGYILIQGDENEDLELKGGFSKDQSLGSILKSETFRLVVGILSVVTGLLKILSVTDGDVPVIGDLVPALMGFLTGFILIFEFYRSRSSLEDSEQSEKINRILVSNKRIIGFAALIAAVLHFLFPRVMLL